MKRQSNIEILRLISMLFITLSHWGGHGTWVEPKGGALINDSWLQFTQYLGELGNCIFILITGYFCCTRVKLTWGGVKNVVVNVKFYALFLWLLAIAVGIVSFTWKQLLPALFPIIITQYWFVLPYLVVMLLSPVINWFLLNRKYTWFLYVLVIIVGIILFGLKTFMYLKFMWVFAIWYIVGGIIRLNELDKKSFRFEYILISFILLAFIYIVLSDVFFDKNGIDIRPENSHFWRFSPIPILGAAGIFILFSKMRFENTTINLLARSAFGIYLITENPYIYPWLWKLKYFDNITFYHSGFMIPISIFICVIVMIGCLLIDILKNKCGNFIVSSFKKGTA